MIANDAHLFPVDVKGGGTLVGGLPNTYTQPTKPKHAENTRQNQQRPPLTSPTESRHFSLQRHPNSISGLRPLHNSLWPLPPGWSCSRRLAPTRSTETPINQLSHINHPRINDYLHLITKPPSHEYLNHLLHIQTPLSTTSHYSYFVNEPEEDKPMPKSSLSIFESDLSMDYLIRDSNLLD